jgi:hypothetical protein
MSIKREDLRVGLRTTGGSIVTAIGANWLLYISEEGGTEFREPIDDFCKGCTEQSTDEIIEVEVCNHKSFIVDGRLKFDTSIERQMYNKTTCEFMESVK